jgi:hypothetical protein
MNRLPYRQNFSPFNQRGFNNGQFPRNRDSSLHWETKGPHT